MSEENYKALEAMMEKLSASMKEGFAVLHGGLDKLEIEVCETRREFDQVFREVTHLDDRFDSLSDEVAAVNNYFTAKMVSKHDLKELERRIKALETGE